MIIDILKGYDGDPTKMDDHRAKIKKASIQKEELNIEEAKTNALELKMSNWTKFKQKPLQKTI